MTPTELYWITRCDSIISVCTVLLAMAIVATMITTLMLALCTFDTTGKQETTCKKVRIASVIAMVIGILACMFIPSTKQCIAIKVIPQIATTENCEKLKTINSHLLDSAIKWLESQAKHD